MRAAGSLDIAKAIKKHEEEQKELDENGPGPEKRVLSSAKGLKPEWIAVFLLVILVFQGYVLFEPHRLDSVGEKVEGIFWENVQATINQRVVESYEDVSQREKMKLAQQQFIQAKSNEKNHKLLAEQIENTKDVYREDGYVYPTKESYDELVDFKLVRLGQDGSWFSSILNAWYSVTSPFVSNVHGNLAWFSVMLGLVCVLLLHRIGTLLYGDYGALVAAFSFGLLPSFFRQFHAGNVNADGVVLLVMLVYVGTAILAWQKKSYMWSIVSLTALVLCVYLWQGYFSVLGAVLIALVVGYAASLVVPRLGKVLHGFGFANKYRESIATLLLIGLMFYLLIGTYQAAQEYTPFVDDSVTLVSKWLDTNVDHDATLTVSKEWEFIYPYYAERDVVALDLSEIAGDNVIVSIEDLVMLDKGGVKPGLTECSIKFESTYCGKYVIRGTDAKAKGKHPGVLINFIANVSVGFEDGNEEALVVIESDRIYAFVVHKDYANHTLTRMMGRGHVPGYEYKYSTDFPRQINVYTNN